MRVLPQVSRFGAGCAHVVNFFDSDDSRVQSAAAFLTEGARGGAALVLIARQLNSAGILARLGDAPRTAVNDLPVTVLDARQTLNQISRNGSPNLDRFKNVVGGTVSRAQRH